MMSSHPGRSISQASTGMVGSGIGFAASAVTVLAARWLADLTIFPTDFWMFIGTVGTIVWGTAVLYYWLKLRHFRRVKEGQYAE